MKMKMKKETNVIQSILDAVKSKEKGKESDQECQEGQTLSIMWMKI